MVANHTTVDHSDGDKARQWNTYGGHARRRSADGRGEGRLQRNPRDAVALTLSFGTRDCFARGQQLVRGAVAGRPLK